MYVNCFVYATIAYVRNVGALLWNDGARRDVYQ